MTRGRVRARTVTAVLTVALAAGCGGGEQAAPSGDAAGGGAGECGRIEVPGHVATQVRTQGADCDTATALVEAAVGQGREEYDAEGFTCEPSDAGGGNTDYTCTGDGAEVVFRYAAA